MTEKETTPKTNETHTVAEAIELAREALGRPPVDGRRVYKNDDLAMKLYSVGQAYYEHEHVKMARVVEKGKTIHEVLDEQFGYSPVHRTESARTIVPREGGKPTQYEASSKTSTYNSYENGLRQHGEALTTISRRDKKGKEVYRFTSRNPELAKKVGSIAAREIVKKAQEHLDKERDLGESIEKLQ